MEPTSSPNDAQSKESKPESPTIILHVLSPSVIEVPNKITFPAIPTSTTIGELKSKICDALTSRPRPERQRLIYRGSLLIQENLTLKDVFTQDTVGLFFPPIMLDLTEINRLTTPKRFRSILYSHRLPMLHLPRGPLQM